MRILLILLLFTDFLHTEEDYIPVEFCFGDSSYFYGLDIRGRTLAKGSDIVAQVTLSGVSGYNQQPLYISCFFQNDLCHRFTEYKDEGTEETYQGYLQANKANGYGTWIHPKKGNYSGNWKDGLKNGFGVETDAWGNKYAGEFQDGMFHGYGKFSWADGREAVGEWVHGKLHGYGSMRFPGGQVYQGEFVQGVPQGIGAFYHPNRKDAILGEVSDQAVSGIAVQFLGRNKRVRVGEFKQNQIDGLVAEKQQSTTFAGVIHSAQDEGVLTYGLSDEGKYLGQVSKGVSNGLGVVLHKSKPKHFGKFADGRLKSSIELHR